MDFKKEIAESIYNVILKLDSSGVEMGAEDIYAAIELPADTSNGDYALPCFRLAKLMKKPPAVIAADIMAKLEKPQCCGEVKILGAYLNFFVDKSIYVKHVLEQTLSAGSAYGGSNIGKGRNIPIDYSSPNIAKPFHVGHLRTTLIGNALYNIYNFLGYKCIGINYLGDWGTQFGKLIEAYKLWGNKKDVEEQGISELNRLYIKFHDEAEKDVSLNDKARNWLLKMQHGDEEALSIWKWFNDISMVDFERIYEKLDVKFDLYRGESYYNDKMGAVVEELKQKNLLVESDGAMIVDLTEDNMPPCLILRSDGGTLYPTRDIAAAKDRMNNYDFEKSLYVTALDQNLHFSQWFKVVEKMGYDWAKDLVHISYGLVNFEGGKLSTRKGHIIRMEDILDEAVSKSLEIIEEKNPNLENKEAVAKQVGIGAIKFNDLYNSRVKDVDFSWSRMLNFEGETGPYVQYSYARVCSVLKKAADSGINLPLKNIDYCLLTDDASFEIAKLLYAYPSKILDAAAKYEPFIITRHMVKLAQSFNVFYHDNPILNAEPASRDARLTLCACVRYVLEAGLKLLGIQAPEKM